MPRRIHSFGRLGWMMWISRSPRPRTRGAITKHSRHPRNPSMNGGTWPPRKRTTASFVANRENETSASVTPLDRSFVWLFTMFTLSGSGQLIRLMMMQVTRRVLPQRGQLLVCIKDCRLSGIPSPGVNCSASNAFNIGRKRTSSSNGRRTRWIPIRHTRLHLLT